jgi:hypothetical protein
MRTIDTNIKQEGKKNVAQKEENGREETEFRKPETEG